MSSSTTQYLIEQLSTLVATHSLGAFVHSLRTTNSRVLHSNDGTASVFTAVDEDDNRTLLGKAVDSVMTATSLAQDGAAEDDDDEAVAHNKQVLDDAVNVFGLVLEHSSLDSANPDDLNEMVSCIEDDDLRNCVCQWIDTASEGQFRLPQDRLESIETTYQMWLSEQDKVSDDEDGPHADEGAEQDETQASIMSQLQAQILYVPTFPLERRQSYSSLGRNGQAVATKPEHSLEDTIAASLASLIPGQTRSARADSEPATEGPPPAKRARRASAGDSPGEDEKPGRNGVDAFQATVHEASGEEEDAEGEEVDEQQMSHNWAGGDIESAVSSHLHSQLFGENQAGPSAVKAEPLAFVSPLPAPGVRPAVQSANQSTTQFVQHNGAYDDEDDEDGDGEYEDAPLTNNIAALLDPSRMAKAITQDVKPGSSSRRAQATEVSSTGQTYTPPSMKPYACTTPGCTARYKQANGLKYHRLHGKCNIRNGSMLVNSEDDEEKRYVCHSAECGKRYKNLNGLKYHYAHSGVHGTRGLQLLLTRLHPPFSKARGQKSQRQSSVFSADE
ncbi:hypothetical protein OIV83_000667 [Microbotryomycetes sp. JL201]|nr:hypothetical protein OIV83_000667 [Microbotryomycetes sp. JL201]